MASTIIEFPFDSGQTENADSAWLPATLLAIVENLRLDLDGRLGVRPGNTALGTTTYSAGAMTAYDLANFSGRLVALGDQCSQSRPTDLFEYVNAKALWRATAGDISDQFSGPRLPRATAVRDIGRIPDLAADVRYIAVTAGGTYVCTVVSLANDTSRIHVFDPDTDQTIVLASVSLHTPRVVYAGSDFWIVGQDGSDSDLKAYNFDPSTDETLTGPTTLLALAARVNDLALAQTGASDFTLAYATATNVEARRYNSAGTVQSTFTVTSAGTSIEAVAVCGNAGGTRLTFAWIEGNTGAYFLKTHSQTGTAVVGPTSLFGGAVSLSNRRLGMVQSGTTISICGMQDTSPTADVVAQTCTNESTHSLSGTSVYADAFLQSGPCAVGSDFYFGAVDNLAANAGTGTNQLVEQLTKMPQCFKDATLAGWDSSFAGENAISSIGVIGTAVYWGNLVQSILPRDPDSLIPAGNSSLVSEVQTTDTGRRQMTQVANQLHIAGALPLVYDGRFLVEQGFAEKPTVTAVEGAAGSLTLLGVYNVIAVWEIVDSRGNILRSQASAPAAVTLTGANDSITATASTPHSLRRHPLLQTSGGVSIRVGFYRTVASGANFHIEQYVTVSSSDAFGAPVTAVLSITDTALADNAVLYEQSQTPVSHVSPPPHQYAWAARERQITGGRPLVEEWGYSKLTFPSEPVEFARQGRLGFSGRANQEITAVAAFEQNGIVWTASEIGQIGGRGPEHSGTGDFDPFTLIPSPGGCQDWRSVVVTPIGAFFQMAPDKLMLLGRDGSVTWIGQAVRATLATYPVITGAVHIRSQMAVVFSCTNNAGSSGVLLVYDLRRSVWYVDTVGPVTAVSEYQGRLAYISGGTVFLQDSAAGSGTFVASRLQTAYLPVTKRLGWGTVYKFGLLVTALGACSVQCLVDYCDGNGFVDHGTETFAGTEGDTERFWSAKVAKTARFSVRFVVTSASADSLGVALRGWAVEVQGSPNMTRAGSTGIVR